MLATPDAPDAPDAKKAMKPTVSSLVQEFLRQEHASGLLEKTTYTTLTVLEALEILGFVEDREAAQAAVSAALGRFATEAGETLGYTVVNGAPVYNYRFRPEVCDLHTKKWRSVDRKTPQRAAGVFRLGRRSTMRLDGPVAEPVATPPKPAVAVSWAVETQKVVSERKTLKIDREALLRLLEAAGLIDETDTAQGRMLIYVRVPGGGDWSNSILAIEEAPVIVEIERTYVETKEA